jgi:hypothetical protein
VNVTIGYIWVERNNQTTLSDDFDCEPEDIFSELNEIAESWENPGLEDIIDLEFPASWGAPEFDEPDLASFVTSGDSDSHFDSFLDKDWTTLASKLEGTPTFAIFTPNWFTPLEWFELSDEKKSEVAAPGEELPFDQYRFGMLVFETSHTEIADVLSEFGDKVRPILEKYCESEAPYGPGSLNHECGSDCAFGPCIKAVKIPAFISVEG